MHVVEYLVYTPKRIGVPGVLFNTAIRRGADSKQLTPAGEQVEETVAQLWSEQLHPFHAFGDAVDDVGYEGRQVKPQLLQGCVHTVRFRFKVGSTEQEKTKHRATRKLKVLKTQNPASVSVSMLT